MPVAAFAVRALVATLAANCGHGRVLAELTAGGASAWRLPLRVVPGWGGLWGLLPIAVANDPGCPTCGDDAVGRWRQPLSFPVPVATVAGRKNGSPSA